MTQYLLIQNEEEAPVEAYTALGFSTACDELNSMGKFGTGSKQAITLLLREGLEVTVYTGTTRLQFSVDGDSPNSKVLCKKGIAKARDTGWVRRFGSDDWDDVGMAIREFVSNALDRHENNQKGSFRQAIKDGSLKVSLVDANERRAKKGFTRVYVEVNDEVRRYFANLGEKFLHFSDHPERVSETLIPKLSPGPARIYRMGGWVCTLEEVEGDSLFDYNFGPHDLRIDESRNSNPYVAKAACARLLRRAGRRTLAILFKSLCASENTFESRLDPDYILSTWETPSADQIAEWTGAWKADFGTSVVVTNTFSKDSVERKGREAHLVNNQALVRIMGRLGIKTGESVLTDCEIAGIVSLPATKSAQEAVDSAWDIVSKNTNTDKQKPGVMCYDEKLKPDEQKLGFSDNIGIHLRHDICEFNSHELTREALKQVLNYVAVDFDDFRNMSLDMIISLSAYSVWSPKA